MTNATFKLTEKQSAAVHGTGSLPDELDEPGYNYYCSVVRDNRMVILLGPYPSKAEAEKHDYKARELAENVDARTVWDRFGICRTPADVVLPAFFKDAK